MNWYWVNIPYCMYIYDCNPGLKVYTTCEFYRGRILQKSSYRKYLNLADIKLTTHAASTKNPPRRSLVCLGHKKPDGQGRLKGQRETGGGGRLSVPLPISSQMDIKNVKRFTRAKETKALVAQLVRLINTLHLFYFFNS